MRIVKWWPLRYKWNRFRPNIIAKASIFVYLPVAFLVFFQSSWRVGNRATVSIGINVHYNGPQAIWRGVDRQFHKKLMVVVRQHSCRRQGDGMMLSTSGRILQHKRLFHSSATSSKLWSQWARIGDERALTTWVWSWSVQLTFPKRNAVRLRYEG